MQVTITTRHLMHMIKEAYQAGIAEAGTEVFASNPEGRPEITAQNIVMRNLLQHNDYLIQQS